MSERVGPGRFAAEIGVLAAISAGSWALFSLWIYPALGWPSAAPIPVRTVAVVVAIALFVRRTGERWSDFGLARPRRLWAVPALAFVFLVADIFLLQPLSDLVAEAMHLPAADLTAFAHLHGNTIALVLWLLGAWLLGGFGEELIFRGFLMRRFADAFGGGRAGWSAAVLGQALLFGLGHFYLGPAGIVSAGLTAVFFGACFLLGGRNLWPLILVHGTWDSLGFVLIYLNGTPST